MLGVHKTQDVNGIYTYIDLALILAKTYQVKVTTALDFITKNKKGPIKEIANNRFIVDDLSYIETHLKDPIPPKF